MDRKVHNWAQSYLKSFLLQIFCQDFLKYPKILSYSIKIIDHFIASKDDNNITTSCNIELIYHIYNNIQVNANFKADFKNCKKYLQMYK